MDSDGPCTPNRLQDTRSPRPVTGLVQKKRTFHVPGAIRAVFPPVTPIPALTRTLHRSCPRYKKMHAEKRTSTYASGCPDKPLILPFAPNIPWPGSKLHDTRNTHSQLRHAVLSAPMAMRMPLRANRPRVPARTLTPTRCVRCRRNKHALARSKKADFTESLRALPISHHPLTTRAALSANFF